MSCSMQEPAKTCCVREVSGSALPWPCSSSSLFASAEPGRASCATANPVLHQCEEQRPATPETYRVLGCLRARLAHCHGVRSAVRLKPVGGQMCAAIKPEADGVGGRWPCCMVARRGTCKVLILCSTVCAVRSWRVSAPGPSMAAYYAWLCQNACSTASALQCQLR